MRSAALVAVVAALGLILESAFFQFVLPQGYASAAPDVPLIVCVYLGLQHHSISGALGAFVIGYLQDSVGGGITGVNAFAMVAIFALVYTTSRYLWIENRLSQISIVVFATALKALALIIPLGIVLQANLGDFLTMESVALRALFTAMVAPLAFSALRSGRQGQDHWSLG